MYRLYEQIQQKGLYLFCLNTLKDNKNKANYIRLQPGPTIDQVYKRYGKNGYLMLIYADSELGLGGFKKMEKCLMCVLIVLVVIWIIVFGINYYMGWQSNPFDKGTV